MTYGRAKRRVLRVSWGRRYVPSLRETRRNEPTATGRANGLL